MSHKQLSFLLDVNFEANIEEAIAKKILDKPSKSCRNTLRWWVQEKQNYGGEFHYRKLPRPYDQKKLVHVVFKARVGSGIYLTSSSRSISKLLLETAQRYGVNIKNFVINKDHIHILCWNKIRTDFIHFLRFFSAQMGRVYKKIYARFGVSKPHSLWLTRPFTRLVSWGKKSVKIIQNYIEKNRSEVNGTAVYTDREGHLVEFIKQLRQRRQRIVKSQII